MKNKYFVLSTYQCEALAIVCLKNDDLEKFNERVTIALKEHFGSDYEVFNFPFITENNIFDSCFTLQLTCYEDKEAKEEEYYSEEINFTQTKLY